MMKPSVMYRFAVAATCVALAVTLYCPSPVTCQQPVSTLSNEPEAQAASTFKFKLNFFASSTGQFEVEGFEGVAPVLEMSVGQTYTFDQTDLTNWYHPLGFAYYPDGALDDKPEVEDDQSLVYLVNGVQPEENLDGYEPEFFFPREAWAEKNYTVQLTITPEIAAEAKGGEIFYFCHIHAGMSGRIKIIGAEAIGEAVPLPALPVESPFDVMCGTSQTAPFAADATPNRCPGQTFLCGEEDTQFAQCMHAIDCKMMDEMRVNVEPGSPVATFMHQMIPHHDNAVNMAKILLKAQGGQLDEETEAMLYAIINGQNEQITYMRGWLKENGYASDHNDVSCEASPAPMTGGDGGGETTIQSSTSDGILVVAPLRLLVAVLAACVALLSATL